MGASEGGRPADVIPAMLADGAKSGLFLPLGENSVGQGGKMKPFRHHHAVFA